MKKWSFQTKLVTSFMLVITVVLIAIFLSSSLFIRDRMLTSKQQELITKSIEIAKRVAAFKENPVPNTNLSDILSNMDVFLDSRIWVLDSDRNPLGLSLGTRGGVPRAGTGSLRGGGMGHNQNVGNPAMQSMMRGAMQGALRGLTAELDSVYRGETWSKVIIHPVYEERMVVVGVPIILSDGRIDGAVVINSPVVAVTDFLRHIYLFIGLGAIVGILLSFIIIRFLTRSLIRPLRSMQETTGAIARGEYDARVSVDSDDEIGKLGGSINHLAADLGQFMLEVAKTEKLRRDFIANVSHELRTPLTVIRGYTEAIVDGTIDDRQQIDSFLQLVRDEAVRLERLIKSLLELSKLQSSTSCCTLTSLAIEDIAAHVVQLIKPLADSKQLNIKLDMAMNLPPIKGDRDRLVQLLLILMDNAVKYTPINGAITLSLLQENATTLLCSIQDNGIGIPAEDLPYIWERFYKVDKSHQSDDGGGSGLGLAIARQIIDLHKTTVGVSSEMGKGTLIQLRFIVAKPG